MTRKRSKLDLARETLRSLSPAELARAAGGGDSDFCLGTFTRMYGPCDPGNYAPPAFPSIPKTY